MTFDDISTKIKNASIIASAMVVLIHVIEAGCDSSLMVKYGEKGFLSLAVPFFFTVSGYFLMMKLLHGGGYAMEVKKRIRTLVVPYFILSTAYVGMMFVCHEALSPFVKMGDFALGRIGNIWGITTFPNQPTLGALWYVRCLFMLVVLSPLLIWIVRRSKVIATTVLLALFVWNFGMDYLVGDMKFWRLGLSKLGIVYFYLGLYLCCYYPELREFRYEKTLGVICLSLGVATLTLPMMIFGFWLTVPRCRFPRWLTECSFSVYVLHMFTLYLVYAVIKALKLMPYARSVLGVLIVAGLIFVLTVIVTLVFKRYMPRVAHIVLGGR